jgi:hypothetical protein
MVAADPANSPASDNDCELGMVQGHGYRKAPILAAGVTSAENTEVCSLILFKLFFSLSCCRFPA